MRPDDEELFCQWRTRREPRLLGEVFDRCSPELLRVATYLCAGNPHAIEDALQATFLTAIDDAASFDPRLRLRPWLLGILTNHVRKQRRTDRRAGGVGEPSERIGRPDPTLDAAATAELRATLANTLERVTSPYREVLVLHLDHGLDSAEIGRALDRQSSTVRTQIARGLALLRDLLPAGLTASALVGLSPAAMAAVRSKILATASPAPLATTLEPAATGARSLLTMLTFGLLTTAAAVAFTFAWPTDPPPSAAPLAVVPAASTAAAEPAPPPRRETAEAPAPQEPPALVAREFTVAVVDKASGAPAVGAMLVCGSREGAFTTRSESLHYAVTDAGGRASFRREGSGTAYRASVVGTAALLEFDLDDAAANPPTIALESGARVSLSVRDASGAAVAGARVLTNAGSHILRDWQPLGVTDAEGRLVATHLQGHGQFVALHDDHAPSTMLSLQTIAGGDYTGTLVVADRGAQLRGRVVRDDGQPCPHALVAVLGLSGWPHVPTYLHADAEGRFAAAGLQPGHVAVVAKTRAGKDGRCAIARAEVAAGASVDLELRIQPGAQVFGAVATPSGLPATISARFVPEAIFELPYLNTWVFTNADAFELHGLVPGTWELRASAGSLEVREVVTLAPGQELGWSPQLPVALPLRLRLRDDHGRPLAGWQVARVEDTGFSSSAMLVTDVQGETNPADAGSDVMWHIAADQLVRVRLFAPGSPFPTMETPPLAPSEASQVVVVPDRLRPARRLRGSVRCGSVGSDGTLPPYQVVVRQPSTGFGELRGEIDGADFTAGPLGAGTYDIEIMASGLPSLHLSQVRVRAEADTELGKLTLGALGRVLVTVPAEIEGASLVLTQVDAGGARYGLMRQPDGSFRSGRVPHGRYRITGLARNRVVTACEVEVQGELAEIALPTGPGPTLTITVHLPPGELPNQAGFSATLSVRDASDQVALTAELGRMFAGRYQPSLDFRFALPPGDYRLRVEGAAGARGEARVAVTAQGGRAEVRLAR